MATTTRPIEGWAGLFKTAFERSQNAMLLSDEHRHIVDVNNAFARLAGRRRSALRGHPLWEFLPGGPLMTPGEWRVFISSDEVTGEAELERPDGERVAVQFAAHPEVVTGHSLVLFVALTVSRWGRHFRRRGLPEEPAGKLSKREMEVVHLVALGATSPEIAATLHISHNTVRKHVGNAMKKLGARSRAQLVAKALGDGRLAA